MHTKQQDTLLTNGKLISICYALLTLIIVVTDGFAYYTTQQNALFYAGLPLFILLIISLVHIMLNEKTWKFWFTANTLAIILNVSASVLIRAINKDSDMYILINTIHAITIVFASGIVLRTLWTYIYTVIFVLCLLLATSITNSPLLNDKIVALIVVLLGTAFVTGRYVKTYQHSKNEIRRLKQEAQYLKNSLQKEQEEINTLLAQIKQKSASKCSQELEALEQVYKQGIASTIGDYIANSSSEEAQFIKKITVLFPQLSPRDLKLCVLLNQGLSTKEIATAMACAPNSIKVYRSQLRKKLNLDNKTNLTSYLQSIA